MNCKKIEYKILDIFDKKQEFEDFPEIQEHLQKCPKCQDFVKHLEKMQKALKSQADLHPSNALSIHTLAKCRETLNLEEKLSERNKKYQWVENIPRMILMIIPILFFATLGWIYLNYTVQHTEEGFLIQHFWTITIIFQNLIMLIFAPILIHKQKTALIKRLIQI